LTYRETSTRLDSRSRRTRAALRQAALALLEKRSFDRIAVREITAAAGVAYPTFFRHYSTKAEILQDIATHEIERIVEAATTALYADDSRAAALGLARYVAEHRPLWSALFTGGAADMMRQEFIRIAVELSEQQPRRSDWLPNELASIHNASANLQIISWWLRQSSPISVEQLATILDRLVITPVLESSSTGGFKTSRQA
jgi:AcrR family transcriptional regulator